MTDAPAPRRVLPVLVLAQLAGTSPWFAVNAVMPELQRDYGWAAADVGTLTSAVQFGFIAGTLLFALLAVADRFSARRVFLLCALAGAGCTLAGAWSAGAFQQLLLWRTLTGFFLAGIYPVGMKIASQWFPRGLGSALGWLIGALILGSASAHAVRGLGAALPWPVVFYSVGAAAAVTQRVKLAATVMVAPMHDPVKMAKQVATLDVLSGGRMVLGVGVGGREEDYKAVSATFDKRRLTRMEQGVARMRQVWPDDDRRTRMVFIARGLTPQALRALVANLAETLGQPLDDAGG